MVVASRAPFCVAGVQCKIQYVNMHASSYNHRKELLKGSRLEVSRHGDGSAHVEKAVVAVSWLINSLLEL
jgi:hypothetical protein